MPRSFCRLIASLVVGVLMMTASPGFAQRPDAVEAPQEPQLWRAMLERLPPATLVAVRLRDGSQIKGVVLDVGDTAFTLKPRTRIPVPAREVAFAEVVIIERQKVSMSPAQKVLLGAGIGSGVVLVFIGLLAAALANS